jgi:L-2-hydroxyglutarate oxidase LhgO
MTTAPNDSVSAPVYDLIYDLVIIGGGILGLATALSLSERRPGLRLALLEKEGDVARHQTGHNSGVIHSGIYYKPGSLKAKLCVAGAQRMRAFCQVHHMRYEGCGKVIVATSADELPRLETLLERGLANGVPGLCKIGADELRQIEPHAAGLCAIHSPSTGIVDYVQVSQKMREIVNERGVQVRTSTPVVDMQTESAGYRLITPTDTLKARFVVNCAGLHSDAVARMAGAKPSVRIVPFRGEYYFLKPEQRHLVRGLIYPVPDPNFPFLGVHFTRTVHGDVEAGPNAVLAFAREGYRMRDVRPAELWGVLSDGGFHRLARKWWRVGAYEWYRSLSKREFVRSLQKLVPAIRSDDVVRGGAGVRAQAVAQDGALVDDFAIVQNERALHVLNAPSPAATASLAIGDEVAERVLARV